MRTRRVIDGVRVVFGRSESRDEQEGDEKDGDDDEKEGDEKEGDKKEGDEEVVINGVRYRLVRMD
jgi:hypothetical protein